MDACELLRYKVTLTILQIFLAFQKKTSRLDSVQNTEKLLYFFLERGTYKHKMQENSRESGVLHWQKTAGGKR